MSDNRFICTSNFCGLRFARNIAKFKLLVAFFLLVSFCGCNDDAPEPVSPMTPEERAAQAEQKETFFATLMQLEARFSQVPFGQQVQDSKIRVKIVDELLTMELSSKERGRALISQMDALTKLHATREITSSERLSEMAETYATDDDLGVARAAKIAQTAVRLVTYIRTDFGAYDPLRDNVRELLKLYPNDLEVAVNLETVAIQLFQREKTKEANEIMAMMLDAYSASSDPRMQRYVGVLKDRIKLVEVNFRTLVQNIEFGSEKDRSDFLKTLTKLANDPAIGYTAYDEISRAGRWLERIQRYKTAGKVYQIMGEALAKHPEENVAKKAQFESEFGLRRLKQIGTKLELKGETVFGEEIDPAEFKDKVVLLMFWSAEKPLSLRAMGELFEIYSTFSRDQFEIIAIATDENAKKPIEVLGTQVPPWTILIPNAGKKSKDEKTLIDDCAVNYVPYTLLIDPEGRVNQINISASSLEERIKRILLDFGKTPTINKRPGGPRIESPVEQTG